MAPGLYEITLLVGLLLPVLVIGAVIYVAVRLAIRHERNRHGSGGNDLDARGS
ncbi:MAG: hypothetical protein ACRDGH_00640 [Candidatus Limnocylindria bacterium]